MRPESLPKSYQDFIQKTGPVAAPVYKAVRDCCRGSAVDIASLSFYLSNKSVSNSVKLEEFPYIIPCSIIHPYTNSCLTHNVYATSATFKKTFPLYFSLTFVPFVVLRLQKVDTKLELTFLFFLFVLKAEVFHFCSLFSSCVLPLKPAGMQSRELYARQVSYLRLLEPFR